MKRERQSQNVIDLRDDSPTRDPMLDYHRRQMKDTSGEEKLIKEFQQYAKARGSLVNQPMPLEQLGSDPRDPFADFIANMHDVRNRTLYGMEPSPRPETYQETYPPQKLNTKQRRLRKK